MTLKASKSGNGMKMAAAASISKWRNQQQRKIKRQRKSARRARRKAEKMAAKIMAGEIK
jgi:hypothetical protein